jgi:predicted Zn-dependent peptidase
VLGGGPYARLFKVVREIHGLCYYASASWSRAKGLMLVQSGVDPKNEPAARRHILALAREVARGTLEPSALRGFREAVAHRIASLADDRGAMVGWFQENLALGTDPSPGRWNALLSRVTPDQVRRVGRDMRLAASFLLTAAAPSRARSVASR